MARLWRRHSKARLRLGQKDAESLGLSIAISGAASLVLVGAGSWLLDLWTDGEIGASMSLLIGLAAWTTLSAVGTAIAMLLNVAAVIRFQLVTAWSMAIVAVILKLILVPAMGVEGAIWATVIAYVCFVVIPDAFFVPHFLHRMTSNA